MSAAACGFKGSILLLCVLPGLAGARDGYPAMPEAVPSRGVALGSRRRGPVWRWDLLHAGKLCLVWWPTC